MGTDEAKLEKKRLKAQVKAEKARAKSGLYQEPLSEPEKASPKVIKSQESIYKPEKDPWYKDPHWIRAIIAIATLVVMVITLIIAIQ